MDPMVNGIVKPQFDEFMHTFILKSEDVLDYGI